MKVRIKNTLKYRDEGSILIGPWELTHYPFPSGELLKEIYWIIGVEIVNSFDMV